MRGNTVRTGCRCFWMGGKAGGKNVYSTDLWQNHDTALDAYREYLTVGGMPQPVNICSKFGVPPHIILAGDHRADGFKGALAENYVMQALTANGIRPYYWTMQQKAELDFIFQERKGNVIPLEVKAAEHVRAKSLMVFMKRYGCPYAIRVSGKNFGFENGIRSVPLYGVFCLEN